MTLTPQGRPTLRAATPEHVDWVRQNLRRDLDDHEAEVLVRVAERIVDSLKPAG